MFGHNSKYVLACFGVIIGMFWRDSKCVLAGFKACFGGILGMFWGIPVMFGGNLGMFWCDSMHVLV